MARRIIVCTELTAAELRRRSFAVEHARQAKRMQAIANVIDGMSRAEAARLADMSDQALTDAIKRYNADGVAGLIDRPRSGRPPKLDERWQQELVNIVRNGPDIEAEGVSAYTRDDVKAIVKAKWNVDYAVTSIGRMLRAGGLSRQKARPSHPKKSPEAVAAFLGGTG
jgi:transposase